MYPPETPTILQYVCFCSLAPTYSFLRIPQLLSSLTHPQMSQLSCVIPFHKTKFLLFWTVNPWVSRCFLSRREENLKDKTTGQLTEVGTLIQNVTDQVRYQTR